MVDEKDRSGEKEGKGEERIVSFNDVLLHESNAIVLQELEEYLVLPLEVVEGYPYRKTKWFHVENNEVIRLLINKSRLNIIPDSISNLKSLIFLDFSNNKIEELPEIIGSLKSLKELYIGGNKISRIHESIGNLPSLQILFLGENDLTTLPDSMVKLTSLNHLDLSFNIFTTFPDVIFKLTELESLAISSNHLTSVPKSIGNLTSLQELYLDNNDITSLPETIGNLKSLIHLNLSENSLTTIPETMGNLKSLTFLNLNDNQVKVIPKSIHVSIKNFNIIERTKKRLEDNKQKKAKYRCENRGEYIKYSLFILCIAIPIIIMIIGFPGLIVYQFNINIDALAEPLQRYLRDGLHLFIIGLILEAIDSIIIICWVASTTDFRQINP